MSQVVGKPLETTAGADDSPLSLQQARRFLACAGLCDWLQRSLHAFGFATDLILDGVIGYSLRRAPCGAAATLIRWANKQHAPILALDTPSGVDTTTGTIYDPAIKATATMTLALPKAGLRAAGVAAQVGELYLADISVPPALYAGPALGLHVRPIFAASDLVRVQW